MNISVSDFLKIRYDDIVTAVRETPQSKKESLTVLRNDILKIKWEYCMPGDVEQLLRKVEDRLC